MEKKKIHFDHMKSWIWIFILFLSLIFILVGFFELFEFENPKLNKRISAIGFFYNWFISVKCFGIRIMFNGTKKELLFG